MSAPMILGSNGKPLDGSTPDPKKCSHGLVFDEDEARRILDGWAPKSDVDFVMGNPVSAEVKRRWPRGCFTAEKPCPLGCGYQGIAYVSEAHYFLGDW